MEKFHLVRRTGFACWKSERGMKEEEDEEEEEEEEGTTGRVTPGYPIHRLDSHANTKGRDLRGKSEMYDSPRPDSNRVF